MIHEREVAASQAGAILRGEPAWLAGWRLRRLVASGGWTAGELAASRSRGAAGTPYAASRAGSRAGRAPRSGGLDYRSDEIDHWGGFVIV